LNLSIRGKILEINLQHLANYASSQESVEAHLKLPRDFVIRVSKLQFVRISFFYNWL